MCNALNQRLDALILVLDISWAVAAAAACDRASHGFHGVKNEKCARINVTLLIDIEFA